MVRDIGGSRWVGKLCNYLEHCKVFLRIFVYFFQARFFCIINIFFVQNM